MLDGIRVIEVANYMSGPFAGAMLADLGAEVIKVEPPGGDPYRKFGRATTAVSPLWAAINRGKSSVVIDLKADPQPLLDLVVEADVFLSNWRPDVAERLGVGDEVLTDANPRLVRCWISGVGPTGPLANDPAFDTVAQGRAGTPDAIATGGDLRFMPGYPVDKTTAMFATQAILAALLARHRTGAGDRLDVALLDAIAYSNMADLLPNRVFLDHEPVEARYAGATAQVPLPASDGGIAVSTVTGKQVKSACAAVGHPEFAAEIFAEPTPDAVLRTLTRLFSPIMGEKPMAHWLEQFRIHDVPAGPCLTIDEHLVDEQVAHNRLYAIEDWPEVGRVRTVRHPAVSKTYGDLRAGPAPVVLS